MRRWLCVGGLVGLLVLGATPSVWAQKDAVLIIHSVTSEVLPTGEVVLVVAGVGFGETPEVALDGQLVPVLAGATPTRLLVLAPAAVLTVPGTYRLTVMDPASRTGDVFAVTGLAGPVGVAGAPLAGVPSAAATTDVTNIAGGSPTAPSPAGGGGITPTGVENPASPYNTAYGFEALLSNTASGLYNSAFGMQALKANTSGTHNTAAGLGSLRHLTTGIHNTAVGTAALDHITTTSNNTAVGTWALEFATGDSNTAVGTEALQEASGSYNAAFGFRALEVNSTGTRNAALGYLAGSLATTGHYNLFLGGGVSGTSADTNTIRVGSAYNGATTPPSGQNRTFIAGIRGTSVASGLPVVIDANGQLGTADTGGSFLIGAPTASTDLAVNGNLLVRNLAEDATTDAIVGRINGQPRLYGASDASGIASIAFRTDPAAWYKGGITFSTNDIDGTDPAFPPVERMRITAAGKVGIGTTTPLSALTVKGNLILRNLSEDAAADMVVGFVSGQPRLYWGSETSGIAQIAFRTDPAAWYKGGITFSTNDIDGTDPAFPPVERMRITAAGRVGIGTTTPWYPLQMASGAYVSAGGVWTNASSRTLKQQIAALPLEQAQAAVAALAPVTYAYTADPGERHVGFIAEDVPDLVAAADRKSLSPMDIVAVVTKVVQAQQAVIAELQQANADLQVRLARLEALVAAGAASGAK